MNTSRVVGQTGLVLLSKHRKLYGLAHGPICEAGSQVTTRMLVALKRVRRMDVENKSMHGFATYSQFRAV